MMEITQEQIDTIGELADTCDNNVEASRLPIPAETHVEMLRGALEEISRQLKNIYKDVAQDDPWAVQP